MEVSYNDNAKSVLSWRPSSIQWKNFTFSSVTKYIQFPSEN